MDIVFDIDGTLADPAHRLHFIQPPKGTTAVGFQKKWDQFLAPEQLVKDAPVPQVWFLLESLLLSNLHKIIFITGRTEEQRDITTNWLLDVSCPIRGRSARFMKKIPDFFPRSLYMRADDDFRASHVVKLEGLNRAKEDGFHPKMAFEDRHQDTVMWRENGLLCCQVNDGQF